MGQAKSVDVGDKAGTDCAGRHVWMLNAFDYPTMRLLHKCRRCGLEKESQALYAHADRPELYKRWRA